MRSGKQRIIIGITLLVLYLPTANLRAENLFVSTLHDFNMAQSKIQPGDTVTWKKGTYKDLNIQVFVDGIIILSELPGEVIFTGDTRCDLAGNNITFSGFQFLEGNTGADVITMSGDNNLVTQVNISNYDSHYYLNIKVGSRYNEVSHSNFENKPQAPQGEEGTSVLQIQASPTSIGYHRVTHCSFLNHTAPEGAGSDYGMEAVRIGHSYQCENISRSVVEYCYFSKCKGDGEIISNKARENVFRYNTFYDNEECHFTLRHGDAAYLYGNFFVKGMGLRIKEGQRHVVFNNYFQTGSYTAIRLMNYRVDPLDSILIAYNTFIECGPILLGGTGRNAAPDHITFANNIFMDCIEGIFTDPTGRETWIGNIASSEPGIALPEGIKVAEPRLISNPEGFFSPSDGSPAIDASMEGFPLIPDIPVLDEDWSINLDLMQGTRPSKISLKDAGCTEFPGVPVHPHVDRQNTGPDYLKDY